MNKGKAAVVVSPRIGRARAAAALKTKLWKRDLHETAVGLGANKSGWQLPTAPWQNGMKHLARVCPGPGLGQCCPGPAEQVKLDRARMGSRLKAVRDKIQRNLDKLEKGLGAGTSAQWQEWLMALTDNGNSATGGYHRLPARCEPCCCKKMLKKKKKANILLRCLNKENNILESVLLLRVSPGKSSFEGCSQCWEHSKGSEHHREQQKRCAGLKTQHRWK